MFVGTINKNPSSSLFQNSSTKKSDKQVIKGTGYCNERLIIPTLSLLFHLPMLTVVARNSPSSLPSGRQFSFYTEITNFKLENIFLSNNTPDIFYQITHW